MAERIERDSMGEIGVPEEALWGAQTERSRRNFPIGAGREPMPAEIIRAFGLLKKAAALANRALVPAKITAEKAEAITAACDRLLSGNCEEAKLRIRRTAEEKCDMTACMRPAVEFFRKGKIR